MPVFRGACVQCIDSSCSCGEQSSTFPSWHPVVWLERQIVCRWMVVLACSSLLLFRIRPNISFCIIPRRGLSIVLMVLVLSVSSDKRDVPSGVMLLLLLVVLTIVSKASSVCVWGRLRPLVIFVCLLVGHDQADPKGVVWEVLIQKMG